MANKFTNSDLVNHLSVHRNAWSMSCRPMLMKKITFMSKGSCRWDKRSQGSTKSIPSTQLALRTLWLALDPSKTCLFSSKFSTGTSLPQIQLGCLTDHRPSWLATSTTGSRLTRMENLSSTANSSMKPWQSWLVKRTIFSWLTQTTQWELPSVEKN